jgi:hypothetical protein
MFVKLTTAQMCHMFYPCQVFSKPNHLENPQTYARLQKVDRGQGISDLYGNQGIITVLLTSCFTGLDWSVL